MKKIISIGILSLLMILFTNYIAKAQDYVPNEVLIKFKKGVGKQARKAAIKSVQGKKIGTFKLDPDLLHLEVPAAIGTDIAISHLTRNPNVKYAARNDIYYIDQDQVFPDDPRFKRQWALHSGSDRDIDAPEAWSISTGSHEIIVAVLDTGVDYNHEDLAANIWINEPEYYGTTGVDDDGNTYIDDIYGWDFAYNDNDPMDIRGHGTMCAGIIGAVGNNGLGITGINWTVKIMCVKVHEDTGIATTVAISKGIAYAIANGAHITSNSYGCKDCSSQAMEDAIEMANAAGILFVASAGNDGWNTDFNPHFPASYNHENIISVTATDNKDNQRYNWGLETVDMAGCSPRITTTRPGNTYDYGFSGTSAACPHIAGVAALVKGYEPSLTHMEVKTRLMDTVRLVPSLTGLCVTEGTVNAYSALSAGGPPPLPPDAPSGLTANVPECNQIDLTWLDNSDNEDGFEIERGLDGVDFAHIGTVGAGATSYSDTTVAENTTYYYRVRAYNTGGDSDYSNVDSARTPPCPPGEPPAPPTDLGANARGKNKIALKWKDNSNNENGFAIERRTDGTSFAEIDTIGANTISYVDTGVSPKTLYYYRVRAYNSNGNSNYSNTASARTK